MSKIESNPISQLQPLLVVLGLIFLVPAQPSAGQDFELPSPQDLSQLDARISEDRQLLELPLCIVTLMDEVEVSARQTGQLKTLSVRQGSYVEADTEVGRIDDLAAQRELEQAQARKAIAESRASDAKDIEYYQTIYDHYKSKYEQERNLKNTARATLTEYLFELRKAVTQIEKAKLEKNAAGLEVALEEVILNNSKDKIERHIVRSPINGNVYEIYKPEGSWVNAGDPIFRVIRMDTLHVEGYVDASQFDRHEIYGCKATVTVPLARGRNAQLPGKITFVGLDQHAGNRYIVKAEVENRSEQGQWLLSPNADVSLNIHLNTRVADASDAPAANR